MSQTHRSCWTNGRLVMMLLLVVIAKQGLGLGLGWMEQFSLLSSNSNDQIPVRQSLLTETEAEAEAKDDSVKDQFQLEPQIEWWTHLVRPRRYAKPQYNSNDQRNQPSVKLIGSYGIKCTTPCSRDHRGGSYNYYFCYGEGTWDYCSNSFEYDYRGKRCKDYCDARGYNYRWCYTEDESWGYCSGTRGY